MFHSLSAYGRDLMDKNPFGENTEKIMALVADAKRTEGRNAHLIRHRPHLRLEIDNVNLVEQVEGHLRSGEVDELSFMDHTPGQEQYRNLEIWRKYIRSDGPASEEEAANIACEQGISLSVRSSEFVGITGRSGSGKSLILRHNYRTNLPESENILYDSAAFERVDLAPLDEQRIIYLRNYEIGYVSQFLDAVPRTTARDIMRA